MRIRPVPRRFYRRDSPSVAPELLNKILVCGNRVGRIVEVEAYAGAADAASHGFRGRTRRNATMFGEAGRLYVYFTYGMHWCANVVCGVEGEAGAVLLRALAPVKGVDEMRAGRPAARHERDLCSGPGKLCQALGISGTHDGADVVAGREGIRILDDGTVPPSSPEQGPRIGISVANEVPWRWWVPGDVNVSRHRGPRRRLPD
ncbi:MAG TPA: DNA-3-methyladenine glycosylase [Acidimicrobiales bacterium]|nr:DNA-3-methyladenine glycosylase [Acidimicrobiales bacterium]